MLELGFRRVLELGFRRVLELGFRRMLELGFRWENKVFGFKLMFRARLRLGLELVSYV